MQLCHRTRCPDTNSSSRVKNERVRYCSTVPLGHIVGRESRSRDTNRIIGTYPSRIRIVPCEYLPSSTSDPTWTVVEISCRDTDISSRCDPHTLRIVGIEDEIRIRRRSNEICPKRWESWYSYTIYQRTDEESKQEWEGCYVAWHILW